MDTKGFIHIPLWVKLFSLTIMLMALGACFAVVVLHLGDRHQENAILVAMSLANTVVTGLAVATVVFFSERDATSRNLLRAQRNWLSKEFPDALRRLRLDPLEARAVGRPAMEFDVETVVDPNNMMGHYRVSGFGSDEVLTMSIIINVFSVSVFFLTPDSPGDDWDETERIFSVTFDGARSVGWRVSVDPKLLGSVNYRTFACGLKLDENFLYNARQRLYWSNDIALMTRSYIIQANRGGFRLYDLAKPSMRLVAGGPLT